MKKRERDRDEGGEKTTERQRRERDDADDQSLVPPPVSPSPKTPATTPHARASFQITVRIVSLHSVVLQIHATPMSPTQAYRQNGGGLGADKDKRTGHGQTLSATVRSQPCLPVSVQLH